MERQALAAAFAQTSSDADGLALAYEGMKFRLYRGKAVLIEKDGEEFVELAPWQARRVAELLLAAADALDCTERAAA